jgi:putative hydrolase of the HAD superfamily
MNGISYLLIDADDTLWENNIYFERATERFVQFLNHSTLSPAEVQAVLEDFERVNVVSHGYGSSVYTRSLEQTFRALIEREFNEEDLATVTALGRSVIESEFELIPHVETTLAYLQRKYTLVLCTKGEPEEQQIKVDRSGLAGYFHQIEIMREKDPQDFTAILGRLGAQPGQSCMVGNSPRSDILPPLSLGMHAVFVPHDHTWQLEHQEIDRSHPDLLVIDRFADLVRYF